MNIVGKLTVARARNIKPAFFMNEALVELPFETRLLFIGLWMLADREGRLEDRPKRIKMALFPADNINIEECLVELEARGLIDRYEVLGLKVIFVCNFKKHQSPHHTEKASELPDEHGKYVWESLEGDSPLNHGKGCVKAQEQDGENPADLLNPDSLNPESLNPDLLKEESVQEGQSNEGAAQLPKKQRQLPKNFVLNAQDCDFAKERGIDHQHELETFKSYHQAKGTLMQDWHAAWRTWCMNGVKYGKNTPSKKMKKRV
ncbi:MAG: hypothetical protein ACRCWR_06415 [Saezia sp.]